MFHAVETFFLVHALVKADSAKKIGERGEVPVILLEFAFKRLSLKFRMFLREVHVLMLGVVFEIRVEAVAPRGFDHIKQPADVVIKEGHDLRQNEKKKNIFADPLFLDHFF